MHYAFVFPAVDESRHLRLIAHIITKNNHICACARDSCSFFFLISSLCLKGLKCISDILLIALCQENKAVVATKFYFSCNSNALNF